MNLEYIKLLLPFLAPIVGFIGTSIIFLKKFIKNKKLNNVLEKAEEVSKQIIPIIIEAEKFVNYTGEEKKNYVMTKLNQFAICNGIMFNEKDTSNKVEELVGLTKKVNVHLSSEFIDEAKINEEIKNESIEQQIHNIIEGLVR